MPPAGRGGGRGGRGRTGGVEEGRKNVFFARRPKIHPHPTLPPHPLPRWILWGDFFVLLFAVITFASAGASLPWHLAPIALLAAIFPLNATAANFSNNTIDALGSGGIGGTEMSRAKTMFAGFLMTSAFIAALIMAASAALGVAHDANDGRKGGRFGSSYEEEGRSGMGAGAPRARAAPPAPAGTTVVA